MKQVGYLLLLGVLLAGSAMFLRDVITPPDGQVRQSQVDLEREKVNRKMYEIAKRGTPITQQQRQQMNASLRRIGNSDLPNPDRR